MSLSIPFKIQLTSSVYENGGQTAGMRERFYYNVFAGLRQRDFTGFSLAPKAESTVD